MIQKRPGVLSLGVAGVATPQPNTLSVAAPLANLTNRAVAEAKIDRIQLATAPVQTKLPMMVGAIRARSSVIVQAELNSQSLRSGQRYELVMQGTYRARPKVPLANSRCAHSWLCHRRLRVPVSYARPKCLRKRSKGAVSAPATTYGQGRQLGCPASADESCSARRAHTHDNRDQTRAEMKVPNCLSC